MAKVVGAASRYGRSVLYVDDPCVYPGTSMMCLDNGQTYTVIAVEDGIAECVPHVECTLGDFAAVTDERIHGWLAA